MSNTPKITDSHTHLDFPDFDDERDDIVARAVEAGVHRMVTICTKLRLEPQVRTERQRARVRSDTRHTVCHGMATKHTHRQSATPQ